MKLFLFDELTKFTSIFQVFDLPSFLRRSIYLAIAKRRSCFHPFSLSLSLSYPPRIASLCPQSRQKRFVRSPRKIAFPHVYYNTHSFFRGTTDASSGRNKTGDRGVTIWFMLEPMSRGRWKVNGIGGAFWTRVNSTRSRELDFVLRGRSCLLLLLVFFSLSFGRKWSDNGEAINESKPMLYNNFVRRIKKDKR